MQTRRAFLALSAGLLALLPGCTADEPEGEIDPGAQTQPVQRRITIPASYLAFTGNTADEAAQDYEDYSDGDIGTSVLEDGSLDVVTLGRGYAWLDTGTMESLFEASQFVRTVETAQDLPVSVPEEIAYENGWVTRERLLECAERYGKSNYGAHLRAVAEGRIAPDRPYDDKE